MLLILLCSCISIAVSLNQLSFSGGGSFGAIEIGILKRILESDNKKYDLYTGISAGALNSGFLSYFYDIKEGVNRVEKIYSTIKNHMIYDILPTTGISIFNTAPLHSTLTDIVDKMKNPPAIHTLIGATNMYSGNLDVYTYEDNNDANKVLLMMSSSAIPGMFPPIEYNGNLYADGGTLSNELLQVEHNGQYLNITYITPGYGYVYNNEPIKSLKEMLNRTLHIVKKNFNNPLASINQDCKYPVGEINKYFVNSKYTIGFNSLDFNYGKELINIGYLYMEHVKYTLC